jgi:imidazolonepropionase-like amidohydrolase
MDTRRVALALLPLLCVLSTPVFASTLALVGAKVYPSPTDPPIENATIVIRDGRIVAVGPSAKVKPPRLARLVTVVNCRGMFITSGYWNSHVHFTEDVWKNAANADAAKLEEHMQTMLTRWGFTTVFDTASFLGNTNALRERVKKNDILGPRILTVGEPLYPKDGIPVYVSSEWRIPQATTPDEARTMARERLSLGADGIKVFAGSILKGGVVLPMDPAIIRAAVTAAHEAGKPVFAHPSNHQGTDNALVGGVDVLAHTIPMEESFTSDELAQMKARHVALIPTISLFPDEERKFGGSKEDERTVAARSVAQLKSYFDLGGTILFGTDVGYTQLYDPTTEYEYMSSAGMNWASIMASMTTTPASFFKYPTSGRIAKGMDADLVVLAADPATDARNFASVMYTIRAGTIIYEKDSKTKSEAGARRIIDQGTIVENVTVISPEQAAPLSHASVAMREGRITDIGEQLAPGPHARRIDGTGKFLIPGLIDSHVHVARPAALDDDAIDVHPELLTAYRTQLPRAYLAFGFTSVVDLDLSPPDRTWFDGAPVHPRLYSCGEGIKVAGGYMAFEVPPPTSPRFPNLVYEPEEVSHWPKGLNPSDYTPEHAVARATNSGAICVKAFVESGFGIFHWPSLRTGTLQQIRTAAERRKLALLVHANGVDSWREAVDAHADVIAHGLWIWPGDLAEANPPPGAKDVIADAARAGIRVQPTMQTVSGENAMVVSTILDDARLTMALPPSVIAYLRSTDGAKARSAILEQYRKASPPPGFEPLLRAAIERTRATVRLMLEDHVELIFGSDTPGVDGPGSPPGLNGRLELQDWADAGVPLPQILRAATLDNAKALGLSREIGSIEVGKRADMLLLKENPLSNVSAYDSIETIFLNGEPIARGTLRGHN